MDSRIFERMSVRVIVGVAADTRRLIRAEGVITEIKSSGICTCRYVIKGSQVVGFYYVETLVSIEGPERGWLERFEVVRPQVPARGAIRESLFAAEKALCEDDKDAILQIARGLCVREHACEPARDKCGPCQRMLRVRDALCAYAVARNTAHLSDTILLIEDYLTP